MPELRGFGYLAVSLLNLILGLEMTSLTTEKSPHRRRGRYVGRACEHHQPHTEALAPGGGRGGAAVVPEVSEGQGGGCSEAAGDGVQDVEERILRGSGQWSGILWA